MPWTRIDSSTQATPVQTRTEASPGASTPVPSTIDMSRRRADVSIWKPPDSRL
jgi:hypothetical protein